MAHTHTSNVGTEHKKRHRRRTYIINPAFQWKYIVSTSAVIFLVSTLVSFFLFGMLEHQARLRVMHPWANTQQAGPVILLFSTLFAVITSVAVGVWCLIVTNRVCGPLYVLEGFLTELARGRIPRLRPLRRKDEFQSLYQSFCNVVKRLQENRQQQLSALDEVRDLLRTAANVEQSDRDAAMVGALGKVEALRGTVAEIVGANTPEADAMPVAAVTPACAAKKEPKAVPV